MAWVVITGGGSGIGRGWKAFCYILLFAAWAEGLVSHFSSRGPVLCCGRREAIRNLDHCAEPRAVCFSLARGGFARNEEDCDESRGGGAWRQCNQAGCRRQRL